MEESIRTLEQIERDMAENSDWEICTESIDGYHSHLSIFSLEESQQWCCCSLSWGRNIEAGHAWWIHFPSQTGKNAICSYRGLLLWRQCLWWVIYLQDLQEWIITLQNEHGMHIVISPKTKTFFHTTYLKVHW